MQQRSAPRPVDWGERVMFAFLLAAVAGLVAGISTTDALPFGLMPTQQHPDETPGEHLPEPSWWQESLPLLVPIALAAAALAYAFLTKPN